MTLQSREPVTMPSKVHVKRLNTACMSPEDSTVIQRQYPLRSEKLFIHGNVVALPKRLETLYYASVSFQVKCCAHIVSGFSV